MLSKPHLDGWDNNNDWSSMSPESTFLTNNEMENSWPLWAQKILDNAEELIIPEGFNAQNEGKLFNVWKICFSGLKNLPTNFSNDLIQHKLSQILPEFNSLFESENPIWRPIFEDEKLDWPNFSGFLNFSEKNDKKT